MVNIVLMHYDTHMVSIVLIHYDTQWVVLS